MQIGPRTHLYKKQISFYLYVIAMPALMALGLALGFLSHPYSFVFACACFSLFCLVTMIRAVRRYGLFALYSLYLYTSFFFVYSKLFFTALGMADFLYVDFPGKHYFSETTGMVFISCSFISFYVLDIWYFYKTERTASNRMQKEFRIAHNHRLQMIGIVLMTISFPLILLKLYMQLQIIRQVGYVALYTGALEGIQYPVWTKGCGTVFYIGFLLVLMSYPKKQAFKYSALMFILFRFADALKGGRGGLIASVLAVMYFYQKLYNSRITIKKMIPVLIVLIVFSASIGKSRTETGGAIKSSSMTDLIAGFVMNQNASIGSPLAVIEFEREQKEFRKYPYIFSVLMNPVYNVLSPDTASTPSVKRLYVRNEMEGIITYLYSPFMYNAGFGIGASFFGEMYDCAGVFGIIFWSLLLGYMIFGVEHFPFKKNTFVFWAWFITSSVVMLPRSHFFDFIFSSYRYFLLILGTLLFANLLLFPKKIHINRSSKKYVSVSF